MPSCVLCVGGWEPPMVSGKAESERGQGPVCGIPGLACPGAGWRGGLGSAALVGGQGESGCLSMGSVAEGRGLLESCPCHILGWAALLPGPRRLGGRSGAGAMGTAIRQVQCWGAWRGFHGEMYHGEMGQQGCSSNQEPRKHERWGWLP